MSATRSLPTNKEKIMGSRHVVIKYVGLNIGWNVEFHEFDCTEFDYDYGENKERMFKEIDVWLKGGQL